MTPIRTYGLPVVGALIVTVACNLPSQTRVPWEEPNPGLFTTGPYILLGAPGVAFIALKADLPAPPIVDWWIPADGSEVGDGAGQAAQVVSVTARRGDGVWVARLENLPIGPYIEYRVRSTAGDTAPSRFRVGVPPGEPFRFAVFGDTRTGHRVHRAVIEAIVNEQVAFFMHTGDMVERGGFDDQWDRFFQIERPLLAKAPIVPAIGNHDESTRNYFRRYFLLHLWAGNRRYYYHDWGNLRVVVVDTYVECQRTCAQFTFAARALEEGVRKGMLLAILVHEPPYSSGHHGSNKQLRKPIEDLAVEYGVEIVFTGHDHDYERTKPIHGVTYVVSGSAGAPIRPVKPQWFTATARTEPHYVLVDVEHDRLVLRAINLKGDTFDTVVVPPNPPRALR